MDRTVRCELLLTSVPSPNCLSAKMQVSLSDDDDRALSDFLKTGASVDVSPSIDFITPNRRSFTYVVLYVLLVLVYVALFTAWRRYRQDVRKALTAANTCPSRPCSRSSSRSKND